MTDLTALRARVQHLGRIAKWCTALSLTLPALLLITAVAVAGVALSTYGLMDMMATAVAILCSFIGVACVVFWVLRRGAQNALAEAGDLRSGIAAALAPTNAGKPSVTKRFLDRQRTARTSREARRRATTRQADVQRSARGDDGNTLLGSLLNVFDSDTHRSHSGSHGHSSYDHGSSHSHSSFDHGSHSSFDGGSFSDGGSSF